jgi:hypothetical protein
MEVVPHLRDFWWFAHKTIGFLGRATNPSLRAQRNRDMIRVREEASRRGTRSVIAGFSSEGRSKTAVDACQLDGNTYICPRLPLRGMYLPFML